MNVLRCANVFIIYILQKKSILFIYNVKFETERFVNR